MSDRLDGRFGFRRAAALLAGALVLGCEPHGPEVPGPLTPVPCTREVAVASDTVVVGAGSCNPGCIHVAVGTLVYFVNGDPTLYLFAATPPLPYEVQVPAFAAAVTEPLEPAGTYTFAAVQWPAATVTIFVE